MSQYATTTGVSVDRSKAELENVLRRFGASQFAYMSCPTQSLIGFIIKGRRIEFTITLPNRDDFKHTPKQGYLRVDSDIEKHWEQACRTAWRELVLLIKAKLVGISSNTTTLDNEFLAYIALPDGGTIGTEFGKQVQKMVDSGKVPLLMEPK
jgi:hypothetical protein